MAGILLPDGVVQLGSTHILFPGGVVQETSGVAAVTIDCTAGEVVWQGLSGSIDFNKVIIDCVAGEVIWGNNAGSIVNELPITDDTRSNAGGGGRKKLKYYDSEYGDSRLADVVIAKAKRTEEPVVEKATVVAKDAKPEQVALVGDLVATVQLPPLVVEEERAEEDIESAIVLLLLAA